MNSSGPGRGLGRNTLGLRQAHEEATSPHAAFPVVEFKPVLPFVLERKTLQLHIPLDGTLVPDLHFHLGQPFGLSTGSLEEQGHGTSFPFLHPIPFLHEKAEKDPHPTMSGGQLKGVDDIEQALQLDLSFGRRYDEVTE